MPNADFGNLDARPDRVDFRDRSYMPQLQQLPPFFPEKFSFRRYVDACYRHELILNQRSDGACTGFGLAAVINFINLSPNPTLVKKPVSASYWMIYSLAQLYDEWEGEDYSGSSCRGAMKGWHKHGVCSVTCWNSKDERPTDGWQREAAKRPLGAYYRVEAQSIADMQSAIHEVGAVFCSARVHEGWQLKSPAKSEFCGYKLPVIAYEKPKSQTRPAGHAFAIVGYNNLGFVIQNSWGPTWGQFDYEDQRKKELVKFGGFAILTYADWADNGHDAWVASMAAPMKVPKGFASASQIAQSLQSQITHATLAAPAVGKSREFALWPRDKALRHSIVMGNDGKLLRREVDVRDARDELKRKIGDDLGGSPHEHALIMAHGGLNDEKAALARAMNLGPWFEMNGIHPIFIVWRTSVLDTLGNIGADMVAEFLAEEEKLKARAQGGFLDRALEQLERGFDRAFEAAAEKAAGKAIWTQTKQNAAAASQVDGGMRELALLLPRHLNDGKARKLHLMGHSAGSILLGHFLSRLNGKAACDSTHLFAPACTLGFALRHYTKALDKGTIARDRLFVTNLSNESERADTVGPYRKSLLYLVSRAFETPRKAALMGLQSAWWPADEDLPAKRADQRKLVGDRLGPYFAKGDFDDIADWHGCYRNRITHDVLPPVEALIRDQAGARITAPRGHGIFDNDLEVINRAVTRITGIKNPKITDLSHF